MIRDELANRPAGEVESILARELGYRQDELCRRLRVDPKDADHLGQLWLQFYEEYKKARTPALGTAPSPVRDGSE